jgi:ribosomal protein S18 acetylase RimI-like enzyme
MSDWWGRFRSWSCTKQFEEKREEKKRNEHGGELVSRLEEEAEKRGCVAIEVTTRKRWVDAQRFYERVGFKKTHVNFTKDLITQSIR